MFRKQALATLTIALLLAGPAGAFVDADVLDYEVRLPQAQISPIHSNVDAAREMDLLPEIADFRSREGAGWRVLQWNDRLSAPSLIAGPAIPMVGSKASEEVIRASVEAFVARNAEILRVDPWNLLVTDVIPIGTDRTQVILTQIVDGLEVVSGRVDLSLWKGKVVNIGSEYFQDVEVSRFPMIDAASAGRAAHIGIPEHSDDAVEGSPRLVILPLVTDEQTEYHLAWELKLRTTEPENVWKTYVDAHDGSILWRESGYQFFEITGNVSALVEENYGEAYDYPLEDLRVRASGTYTGYTDENGDFVIDVTNNVDHDNVATLYGYFCNANNYNDDDAEISILGGPGEEIDFYFDGYPNSTAAERCAFYHTNVIHDWIQDVDPTFDDLDYAMGALVNVTTGTCNAYWNGSSMTFYAQGGGCNNIGQISEVVYHEYGHGITQKYYNGGAPTSSGMGEAFSDIASYCIHPNPEVGENFYTSGAPVRTGENLRQYPGTECGGQVHCLGEITMGAMWKTRKNFQMKYGSGTAEIYDALHINTVKTRKYSIPTYLTQLLTNNDDDGDLTNGTPDWNEICDGFAMHNLPCPDLESYVTVSSDRLEDQPGEGPYDITAVATAVGGGSITLVEIYYTTDPPVEGAVWQTVAMAATGNPDEYDGQIPGHDCGSLISYYVRAEKTTGEYATAPYIAPFRNIYQFSTGAFEVAMMDDLETDQGWTIGSPDDDATQGIWERVDPVGKTSVTWGATQPEDDVTEGGTHCFVTDGRGGAWSSYDVDGGVTSVVSPTFDWAERTGVASISWYSFYFDYQPIDDTLRCAVSNDDGATWTDIFKQNGPEYNEWTYHKVYLTSDELEFTNKMKFRFQMEDINSFTTCAEAAVDEIEIHVSECLAEDVDDITLPIAFSVDQNRPNPFNPKTSIRFGLPSAEKVEIKIFDAAGRQVRALLDENRAAGYHTVIWDGLDNQDNEVGSGVYYYTVKAGDHEGGHKMILLK